MNLKLSINFKIDIGDYNIQESILIDISHCQPTALPQLGKRCEQPIRGSLRNSGCRINRIQQKCVPISVRRQTNKLYITSTARQTLTQNK